MVPRLASLITLIATGLDRTVRHCTEMRDIFDLLDTSRRRNENVEPLAEDQDQRTNEENNSRKKV